ncbi:MAG: ABC transporter ATP-binding protein [Candidatus Methylacidiphilales bacterium]
MKEVVLTGIYKSFRHGTGEELPVLCGLDLVVRRGEVVSIQGSSGSGKSTLLHLMAGLDRPNAGSISWDGSPCHGWSRGQWARWRLAKLGFVFQSYHLLPELTVRENVMVPGWLAGRPNPGRADQLLKEVGLGERAGHRPGELSGGEQQRAAIARALANDPELILADEPTGNLDPATAEIIIKLLLDLAARKQKALVLVTHDPDLARRAEISRVLRAGQLHPVS